MIPIFLNKMISSNSFFQSEIVSFFFYISFASF